MVLISILIIHQTDWNILELTLDSIDRQLCQYFITLEIIILTNDNSLTEKLFVRYPNKWYNNMFHIEYEPESGFENSLKHADGDWICLLTSGDTWLPDKIESQLYYLLKYNKRLVHYNYQLSSVMGDKTTLQKFLKTLDWNLAENLNTIDYIC
jgi:glycosyltransferase involved in cell wall biosynthesis